jgi:hypothetical protein
MRSRGVKSPDYADALSLTLGEVKKKDFVALFHKLNPD